jgi:hypothetical protein
VEVGEGIAVVVAVGQHHLVGVVVVVALTLSTL